MKRRTIALALALCLLLLAGAGTLAYFKTSKSLSNFFSVAGYDPQNPNATISPETLFSLKLYETDTVNGGRTEDGNTYSGILPGDILVKDPTITNTGKYDAWARMTVTVTDAEDWQAVCEKHEITNLKAIFGGFEDSDWERNIAEDEYDETNKTLSYTYYYQKKLEPGQRATLFKTVTIPASFDAEDMSALSSFEICIVGESIQARNTGDSAEEAFSEYWEK